MIVQNTTAKKVVASFATGDDPPFDGMAEIYYDCMEDRLARSGLADQYRPMLFKDEENFIDRSDQRIILVMEEHIIAEKAIGKAF